MDVGPPEVNERIELGDCRGIAGGGIFVESEEVAKDVKFGCKVERYMDS